jgi:hypothetical protein
MNVTSYITVDYENKSPIWVPKKRTQFPKRQKTIQTSLLQRIMKKTALSASDKTNPIKANIMPKRIQSNPISPPPKGVEQQSDVRSRPSVHERDEKNRSLRSLIGPRCPWRRGDCLKQVPALKERSDNKEHFVACWNC